MHRLRTPDIVTGVSAVVLLISLFLPWYSYLDVDVTATEAFSFVDLWLLLVAGLGIAVPVVTALRGTPALPIAMDVVTSAVAFIGLLLVLFRVLNMPGPHGV